MPKKKTKTVAPEIYCLCDVRNKRELGFYKSKKAAVDDMIPGIKRSLGNALMDSGALRLEVEDYENGGIKVSLSISVNGDYGKG
jgi:hypothetical protein